MSPSPVVSKSLQAWGLSGVSLNLPLSSSKWFSSPCNHAQMQGAGKRARHILQPSCDVTGGGTSHGAALPTLFAPSSTEWVDWDNGTSWLPLLPVCGILTTYDLWPLKQGMLTCVELRRHEVERWTRSVWTQSLCSKDVHDCIATVVSDT